MIYVCMYVDAWYLILVPAWSVSQHINQFQFWYFVSIKNINQLMTLWSGTIPVFFSVILFLEKFDFEQYQPCV